MGRPKKVAKKEPATNSILGYLSPKKKDAELHSKGKEGKEELIQDEVKDAVMENEEAEEERIVDNVESEEDDSFLNTPVSFGKSKRVNPKRKQTQYKFSLDKLLQDQKEEFIIPEVQEESGEEEESKEETSKEKKRKRSRFEEDDGIPLEVETPAKSEKMKKILQMPNELALESISEPIFVHTPTIPPLQYRTSLENTQAVASIPQLMLSQLALDDNKIAELLKGGWIRNTYNDVCLESVMQWMFNLVAFSPVKETAVEAFRTMETLLKGSEARLPFILGVEYPKLQFKPVIPPEDNQWSPGFRDFMDVFKQYGADIEGKKKKVGESSQEATFPVFNFSLILGYLDLCINFKPQSFTDSEVKELIQLCARFFLDSRTSSIELDIEVAIANLLKHFSKEEWNFHMVELCKLLAAPIVTTHHQNLAKIVKMIPSTSKRGMQLQRRLGLVILHDMLHLQFDEELFKKSPIKLLLQAVQKIKITKKTDISRLCAMVSLVDFCLNDLHEIRKYSTDTLKLKKCLDVLNSQIREVSGYDLLNTKVKDILVSTASKLSLLSTVKSTQASLQFETK